MLLKDKIAYALFHNLDDSKKRIEENQKQIAELTDSWRQCESNALTAMSDKNRALRNKDFKDFFKNIFQTKKWRKEAKNYKIRIEELMRMTEELIGVHKIYARGLLKHVFDQVPKHSEECQRLVFLNRAMARV